MSHGLPDAAVLGIRAVLARFPAVEKAVLYGSRAKGNFQPGSDIDLALMGDGLTVAELGLIADELDELLLPYMIDLTLFHLIDNPELLGHIERVGQVFYEKREEN
ncbi:MAG: nucleotidyltransferase domain-containing protein [Desulfuromonadaceae bacterium]|nr:nucleotidyltransferase domain-containing protein [Desulfuromonadaceae bacterium]